MRVLRVVSTMNPKAGGVVEAISQAATSFVENGMVMDVLCFDSEDSSWITGNKKFKIFPIGKSYSQYSVNFKYLNWLLKNSKSYDVVILDGLWQFFLIGGYFLRLLRIRFYVFSHGMLDPYFNENKLKYLKKIPFWFVVDRNIISLSNGLIFTCEEEKKLAEKSFPCYRAQSKIVSLGVAGEKKPSAVLTSSFYDDFPLMKNKKIILFLSRIDEKKGIDLLIDAVSKMDSIPDDYAFVIAGPDSSGMKEKLMKKASGLNVLSRFFWLGMLSGDKKWGAYHASEAFILPSHQENFGIVVAESLSTSTPVLITNKVNIWREIDADSSGFVENDDVEGVVNLLTKWLGLACDEKIGMSIAAQRCYTKRFSNKSANDSLVKVLSEKGAQ